MPELSRAERRDRRLRQLLVELDRHDDGLTWNDAWPLLVDAVPLVDDDVEKTTTGAAKGENDVRWQLTNLDKAGWVLTGASRLRITSEGRKALERYADPAELYAAGAQAYKAWEVQRDSGREEVLESEPSGVLLRVAIGEPAVLRAAGRLLGDGLRLGGSAFEPGRAAWGRASVAELHTAFVENPDLGTGNFQAKLAGQLRDTSDEAILLAAEILALLSLPLADFRADTKRQRVKSVLALMSEPAALPSDINAAMDFGIFNGSLAFKTQIWRALSTGIEVAAAWWRLSDDERQTAWADPWAWRAMIDGATGDTTQAARAELRYLAHPETFLPIISGDDRRRIRDVFGEDAGILTDDVERDLLEITLALQAQTGGPIDYYQPPFVERWRQGTTQSLAPSRRAWLVRGSSVKGIDMTTAWAEEGFVSLAASQLSAVDAPFEPAAVRAAVDDGYAHLSYAKREEKQRDVRAFLSRMERGDLLLTTSGGLVRIGEITGTPAFVPSDGGLSNLRRTAAWTPAQDAVDFADLPPELAGRLKGGSDVTDLTDVVGLVESLLPGLVAGAEEITDSTAGPVILGHLSPDRAADLLVGQEWLDECVDLLSDKRQVILYGPPGTGKTYLAQAIAEAIAPPENVKLVQFHPAYSYEDFFEGYRPVQLESGQVGFKLKPGPFRRIVDDALEHPDQPYILIVDEINRGNLAKVFGELYFLLEYRDAAIDLLYSEDDGKQFQLPKNVFLIGTMNTADRSIALVDAAMRRRFAFLSLHPTDAHMRDVLAQWLQREELSVEPAELLAVLNERLPDQDLAIGPSYLMSTSAGSEDGLQRIWRSQIMPLLAEYHVGESIDLGRRYGLEALRAELARRAAADRSSAESPLVAEAPEMDAAIDSP